MLGFTSVTYFQRHFIFSCIFFQRSYFVFEKRNRKERGLNIIIAWDGSFDMCRFQIIHGESVDNVITVCMGTPNISSLTLKAQNKICSRRHFNFLLLSYHEDKVCCVL